MTERTYVEVACDCPGGDCGHVHRRLTDRVTGYATENVTPITALEQGTIDALWDELTASLHGHNEYGPMGCALCRHREAERVSRRFPATPWKAVAPHEGERF